jgi:predicted ATPase/class 3 adenylate cyclase
MLRSISLGAVTEQPPVGTIAMLFTDVEGSTRLARQLGSAWPEVLAEHNRIIGGAIAAEGGYVDGTEGDAFFATFADPAAAGRAAVAALRGLRAHGWPSAVGELKVRMGLHVGFVERTATGYVGLEVHRAARVAAAAHGGQLLMSSAARDLVEETVPVHSVGAHRLKDFPAPEALYCAVVDGRGAGAFPPPRAYEARPTNLPAGLPALLGRETDLRELHELLTVGGERLVTVTGRGGSGKTTLALVAGDGLLAEHPGGVWLVSLAATAGDGAVLRAVAAAVGAEGALETTPLEAITARLSDRGPALIILDNVEHLVSDAAAQIAGLLESVPQLRIVATSQMPLRIDSEYVLALDALDDMAALALIERVARRRARPVLLAAADREALLDVVHLLDGLPLALELAAARLALLTPLQLRDRLRSSLDLLHEERSDRPRRQRSLAATLDWTLDLLEPSTRGLFVRLAVFTDPVEVDFLEAVVRSNELELLDALGDLLDVGLVRRVETGDGRVRFALPEALRQIAAVTLDGSADGVRWRRSHAHHVADLVWPARAFYVTRAVYDAAWQSAPEASAALQWASHVGDPVAGRIAVGLAAMLVDHGRIREALETLDILGTDALPDPEIQVYADIDRIYVLVVFSRQREAEALLERALALAPDDRARAVAMIIGATMRLFGGDAEQGLRQHIQATEVARRADDATLLAGALMFEAQAQLIAGQLDAVEPTLAEAERIGLPAQAACLDRRMTIYADLAMSRGHTDEALERYVQSLAYAQRAGNELQVLFDLLGVARALAQAGDDESTVEVSAMAEAHGTELRGPGETIIGHLLGEGAIHTSRLSLGPEREAAAAARGRAVPVAQRVERASALALAAITAAAG